MTVVQDGNMVHKPKLTGGALHARAKEIAPLRTKAYALLEANPSLTARDIHSLLSLEGHTVSYRVCTDWVGHWRNWRKKHPEPSSTVQTRVYPSWDSIIGNVPDVETLGLLVLQGFMARISTQASLIDNLRKDVEGLTQQRDKAIEELNRLRKVGKNNGR